MPRSGPLLRVACSWLALAFVAAASAASAAPEAESDLRTHGAAIDLGSSWIGNYLAARHAHTQHDYPSAVDYLASAWQLAPDEVDLIRRVHDALVIDGQISRAADVARKLQQMGAESRLGDLTLAVEALREGRPEEAEAHVSALSSSSINNLLKPLLRAWALYDQGRLDIALDALTPLVADQRTAPLYHLHAGLLNDLAGRTHEAEEHYLAAAAAETAPSFRLVQVLGRFYQRTGQPEKARELYRQFSEEQPSPQLLSHELDILNSSAVAEGPVSTGAEGAAEAMFGIASAVARQNAQETALVLAHYGLALRPDFPALQLIAAQLMESFERYREANDLYRAIDPASGLYWPARLNLAVNLDRLDDFDGAAAVLEEMAAERPNDPEPLVELGDLLRSRERFREAVDAYDQGVARIPELQPKHWGVLYARGIALERSKMWERAEKDFLKALEFEPDQPLVLNYLGYSWVEQGRNLDRALTMIRKAVEQRPNDGYIVDSLGWAYYQLHRYEDAVEELERAVELRPDDPTINDHLGDAYWEVGRHREARFQWHAALDLDPEPELRDEITQKLARGPIKEANAAHD